MLPIGPVQTEPWIPILEGPLGRSPYGPRVFQAAFTLPGRRRFPISVFTIGFPVFAYVPSRTSIARNWSRSAVFHSVASFGRNHNGKECRWRYWPVINYGYRLIRSQSSFRSLSLMAQKKKKKRKYRYIYTKVREWESKVGFITSRTSNALVRATYENYVNFLRFEKLWRQATLLE